MRYRGVPESNNPRQSAGLFLWRVFIGVTTAVTAAGISWFAYTFDGLREAAVKSAAQSAALAASVLRLERQVGDVRADLEQYKSVLVYRVDRLEIKVFGMDAPASRFPGTPWGDTR